MRKPVETWNPQRLRSTSFFELWFWSCCLESVIPCATSEDTLGYGVWLPAAVLTHWRWAHWTKHDTRKDCCCYRYHLGSTPSKRYCSYIKMFSVHAHGCSGSKKEPQVHWSFLWGAVKLMSSALSMVSNCLCQCLTAHTEIKCSGMHHMKL